MQYTVAVILGVLAAIGALTLIAMTYVMRFGDSAFASLKLQ
jgi:hypothetical protein